MTIRDILLYPEDQAALRRISEQVRSVNRQVRALIADLKDTLMAHPEGVGLAAPQINQHRRVIVVQLGARESSDHDSIDLIALINPRVIEARDVRLDFDGCLSIPGLYGQTARPHFLRIAGLDEHGKSCKRVFEDFDAVIVHHEIDHLDGVLFIDRIERLEDLYRVEVDRRGQPVRVPVSTFQEKHR
jgi:peptide deformylase